MVILGDSALTAAPLGGWAQGRDTLWRYRLVSLIKRASKMKVGQVQKDTIWIGCQNKHFFIMYFF